MASKRSCDVNDENEGCPNKYRVLLDPYCIALSEDFLRDRARVLINQELFSLRNALSKQHLSALRAGQFPNDMPVFHGRPWRKAKDGEDKGYLRWEFPAKVGQKRFNGSMHVAMCWALNGERLPGTVASHILIHRDVCMTAANVNPYHLKWESARANQNRVTCAQAYRAALAKAPDEDPRKIALAIRDLICQCNPSCLYFDDKHNKVV